MHKRPGILVKFRPMIQFSYPRLRQIFLILLPVVAIILFYLIKVFQFQQNQESFYDGITTLHLSRGWLDGKVLLHDNLYGDHSKLHNFYFVTLLGPLTKFTGIYGLFIAYLALLAIFFILWHQGFKSFGTLAWRDQWLAAIFYTFGPIAYFIFLDLFGWHSEHYFIPLMALLALSLARRWFVAAAFLTVLIFTVKETSGVLIFCVLVFCSITDRAFRQPCEPAWKSVFHIRNVIIAVVCFVAFCAALWWLSHLNDPQQSRLAVAMKKLWDNSSPIKLLAHTLPFCGVAFVVTTIGLLPFVPMFRSFRQSRLILWTLLGCCSLLSTVYFFESLFYFRNFPLGLSYAPRIGGLWGFIFSAYIFFSYRLSEQVGASDRGGITWTLTALLVQFLFGPFLVTHSYRISTDYHHLKKDVAYMVNTRFGLSPFVDKDAKQLYSLAKHLPADADVIVPVSYLVCFQNVYAGTWGQETDKLKLWKKCFLFVYEKNLIKKDSHYRFPHSGFTVIPNEKLLILAESKWYKQHFK
jgi:hypothetical protein